MKEYGPPKSRSLSARWAALSARTRERVILGSLVGLALAARDLVLLASAMGTFAALELVDAARPAPRAAGAS